jgi:hypothetical protein
MMNERIEKEKHTHAYENKDKDYRKKPSQICSKKIEVNERYCQLMIVPMLKYYIVNNLPQPKILLQNQ